MERSRRFSIQWNKYPIISYKASKLSEASSRKIRLVESTRDLKLLDKLSLEILEREIDYNGNIIKNSFDLSNYILKEAEVAVVPGIAFEAEGYLRISYATSMENIKEGLDRIEKLLK
jgi:hypothetical protein